MNVEGKSGAAPSGSHERGAIPAMRRRFGIVAGGGSEDESRLRLARNLVHLVVPIERPTDPARAAQLAILRNAVASGRYQPDPRHVARKLLVDVAAERPR
jgi:hypothetical protein